MTQSSFDKFWPILLDHEGRELDTDYRDPGNWTGGEVGAGRLIGTKFGIDAASHWRECDIPNLTELEAKAIYLRAYAAPIAFDRLPVGVDVAVLDSGINSGVFRAAKWLQEVVGVEVDGWIGPKTLAATNAAEPIGLIDRVLAERLQFLKGLAIWPVYGGGWSVRLRDLRIFARGLMLEAEPQQELAA